MKCCECDNAPPKFFEMKLQKQSSKVDAPLQRKTVVATMTALDEASGKFENTDPNATLKLTVINTGNTEANSELEISQEGLKGTLRDANDGAVYFGCKKRAAQVDGVKGQVLNDFLLPVEDPELRSQHRGRHFMIFYDLTKSSYFIRDLAVGFGVFARLEFPIVRGSQIIKDNHMLSIGESFCIFNITGPSSNSVLQIKAFTNSSSGAN